MNELSPLLSNQESTVKEVATAATAEDATPKPKVSAIGLLVMIFFLVCGGAYGTEDLVSSIPPLYALLAMALSAIVWSIPIALMTAELSIAVPHDSAYIEWTRLAFGSFASRLEAAIISICLVIDQAIYPKIFVAYVTQFFTFQITVYWQEYLVYIAFALLALLVATFGIVVVEKASTFLYLMTLIPFMIFVLVGFSVQIFDYNNLLRTTKQTGPSDFGLFLSVLVWATHGYEYSGALANSLASPAKTYPRIICLAVFIVTLTYSMPMMVTFGTYDDYEHLKDGDYPAIAWNLGAGHWLGYVLMVGGIMSSTGTYISYLSTSSKALAANFGWNFKILMLLLTATTLALVPFDFADLIEFEMFLFVFHIIFVSGAFVRLRLQVKDLERPFNAFGKNIIVVSIFASLPVLLCIISILFKKAVIIIAGTVSLAVLIAAVFIFTKFIEARLKQ